MQFYRNTQELGKFANSCGNRNCGIVFPQLFSSSQRGNSLLHTANKAWLLANENAITCQISSKAQRKVPVTASQGRKNINGFLEAIYFTLWSIMASTSFIPALFCILFISCWLVQTESFSSNGVGKRTFKLQKTIARHVAQSRTMQRGRSGARGTSNVLIHEQRNRDF